jgi:hypothetical protein
MSRKPDNILDRVMIAAPCSQSWEGMEGTENIRFCQGCEKNVYNISAMTRMEAEKFLLENGTTPCVRFYRRSDGTLITDNCPVALRGIRDRFKNLSKLVAGFATLILGIPAAGAQDATNIYDGEMSMGDPVVSKPATPPKVAPLPLRGQMMVSPIDQSGNANKGPSSGLDGPPASKAAVKLHAKVSADRKALELYTLAQNNQASGKTLVALSYYRQALAAMNKKCDWKFKEMVERDMKALEQKESLQSKKNNDAE